MKNIVKLFVAMRSIAIIAFVAVIVFSMSACDDGGDDGNNNGGGVGVTVTVSIEKIDNRTFTITQEGSKWSATLTDNTSGKSNFFAEATRQVSVTYSTGTGNLDISGAFELTRNSDTLVTFTLRDIYTNVSGTITLNSDNIHGWPDLFIFLDVNLDKDILIINSAKASITF
ncbi:hypothetical protein R84B8_01135 [Treponema sp. R8-4-B8]